MKKNVFNQIIIITLITIILFNCMFKCIVFANSTTEALEDITVETSGVGGEIYKSLKRELVNELREQLKEKYNYTGNVEQLAEALEIDLDEGNAQLTGTEGSGKIIKIDDDTTLVVKFDCKAETGANPSAGGSNPFYTKFIMSGIEATKNTGADNTDEKNEETAEDMEVTTNNEFIVNGQKFSGDTNWDLGGILLKPFFFLINCIVDTLLAVLQKFMYSDTSDLNLLSNYVKTNYIDKLRVVDSRNIDPMFQLSSNQIDYIMWTDTKIGSSEYPHIHYSPEEIFSGQISLLNIDFISGEGQAEGLGVLRAAIANWYKTMRLIATVGFLSVLIFIGIKIIISASSKDKAKYKEWIIDWIIGLGILYFMHYIMAFIISLINQLNTNIGNTIPILRVAAGNGYESFSTNLIGFVRFCTQYDTVWIKVGYEAMYILLVVYTFKFTFIYIKRVLYMAFLTLIAPIIAFTYPIDKTLDGKAQGFSMWFKEFFFNALLQPMHYLLYYIMVSSSMEIAITNPLYAIAVLAFMTEAERLIRKIFGFDKAREGMVGGLGTAFSAVALVRGAKRLSRIRNSNRKQQASMSYPGGTNSDYKNQELLLDGSDENYDNNDSDKNDLDNDNADNNNSGDNSNSNSGNNSHKNTTPDSSPIGFTPSGRPRLSNKIKTRPIKKQPLQEPIRQIANKAKNTAVGKKATELANTKVGRGVIGGTKAVGKSIARPIWDFDRSGKYNFKRLARKVAKSAVGTGIGLTAAAVQAGISLTDGKYSPIEGIAAFTAGHAIAGRVVDNAVDTFETGFREGLSKEEKMKEYKEQFKNRDDVIQFCKDNYGKDWKEYRDRIVENYVSRGFINLEEIKQGIKYADNIAKEVNESRTYLNDNQKAKTIRVEKDKQDVIAMYILSQKKKRKKIHASAISYNKKKEEKYLRAVTQNMAPDEAEKVKKQEMNISASIRMFDNITQS